MVLRLLYNILTGVENADLFASRENIDGLDGKSLMETKDIHVLTKVEICLRERSDKERKEYAAGEWRVHKGIGEDVAGYGAYPLKKARRLLRIAGEWRGDPFFANIYTEEDLRDILNHVGKSKKVKTELIRIVDDPLETENIDYLKNVLQKLDGYDAFEFWQNTNLGGDFVRGIDSKFAENLKMGDRSGGDYVFRGRYAVRELQDRLNHLKNV